jgi:hypothetical protein
MKAARIMKRFARAALAGHRGLVGVLAGLVLAALNAAPLLAQSSVAEWRTLGARPALVRMLADGELTAAEHATVRRLSAAVGTAQEVAIPDGPTLVVTPRAADKDLLATLSGDSIDLAFLWEKDLRVFVQLSMLSESSYRRLRRYAASRFFEFPAQADQLGRTLRQRLEDWYHHESMLGTTRAFMTDRRKATTGCAARMTRTRRAEVAPASPVRGIPGRGGQAVG